MQQWKNKSFLHVKLSGGATAQCLGLMNAIYASNKLSKPFKISYYPHSTGTFWPFAIKFLLHENEILNSYSKTKGLGDEAKLEVGKIITEHPLFLNKFSHEKLLSFIRFFRLESKLLFLRRELSIKSSPSKLIKINRFYKTITGGFAQINEFQVNTEMNARFQRAGRISPFNVHKSQRKLTVIHYRLGDKKATPTQMQKTKDFNTDLIIHPISYKEVLDSIKDLDQENIFVVSDEPNLAQSLLVNVGIKAKINLSNGNIWDDVLFMAQANFFIGSKSQVSQLVNICVENNGGKSFMLNFSKHQKYTGFKNTSYLTAKFLEPNHKIYSLDYDIERNTHSAY